jgi:hypothetical protein
MFGSDAIAFALRVLLLFAVCVVSPIVLKVFPGATVAIVAVLVVAGLGYIAGAATADAGDG